MPPTQAVKKIHAVRPALRQDFDNSHEAKPLIGLFQ
jgi:hypothetical protein